MGRRQVESTAGAPAAQGSPPAPARRVLSWLAVIVLVASAVLGSNLFSVRDDLFGSAVPEPARPAVSRDGFAPIHGEPHPETSLRSAPWWQNVASAKGTSSRSAPFTIGGSAIQWRARASCTSGRLLVRVAGQPKPLVDTACPRSVVGYGTGTGAKRAEVQASAPWRLQVSQQIDAPLVEPPLKAMTAPGTRRVATGSLYGIDQTGKGKLTLYHQPDGRYSMRLDHFFVSPNVDLELRLSRRRAPRSSREYMSAPSKLVGPLDVTAGSLNYLVPAGLDPTRYGSAVVWCVATRSAYAGATLKAAG